MATWIQYALLVLLTSLGTTAFSKAPIPASSLLDYASSESGDRDDRCSISGFVGITHTPVNSMKQRRLALDVPGGTLVTNVIGCTPAEQSGIQPLDYLYAVNGRQTSEEEGFFCLLKDVEPGDRIQVGLVRAGRRQTVQLTMGTREDACHDETPYPKQGFFGLSSGHTDREPGVVVQVSDDGPSAKLGLEDGDRIIAVNGYPVGDWEDISTVKRLIEDPDDITIDFRRDGALQSVQGAIADRDRSHYSWNWNDDGERITVTSKGGKDPVVDIDVDEIEKQIEGAMKAVDWDEIEQSTSEAVEAAMQAVREALTDLRGSSNGAYGRSSDADPEEMVADVADISPTSSELDALRREIDMPRSATLAVREFAASPNPSDGRFRLSFSLPQRGPTSVAIYSIEGREVYRYDLGSFTGTFSDELDVMRNGPGTYVLVVMQGEQMFLRKLIFAKR